MAGRSQRTTRRTRSRPTPSRLPNRPTRILRSRARNTGPGRRATSKPEGRTIGRRVSTEDGQDGKRRNGSGQFIRVGQYICPFFGENTDCRAFGLGGLFAHCQDVFIWFFGAGPAARVVGPFSFPRKHIQNLSVSDKPTIRHKKRPDPIRGRAVIKTE